MPSKSLLETAGVKEMSKEVKEVEVDKDNSQEVIEREEELGEGKSDEGKESEAENKTESLQGIAKSKKRSHEVIDNADEDRESDSQQKKQKLDIVRIFNKLNQMDSEIDEMKQKLDSDDSKQEQKKEVKTPNAEEDNLDAKMYSINSIEELESNLESLHIKKEEEVKDDVDGFFCSLCFDGSKPNWNNKNQSGTLKFNKAKNTAETSGNQSMELRNLKCHIKIHVASKNYKQKKEIQENKIKMDKERKSREPIAGMNVYRIRYLGIQQSKSRIDFEEDMLKAKLNEEVVGNLNHSRMFAAKLDEAIYSEMKEIIKENMNKELDVTGTKRVVGLMMDKMTPNKRTGQMHGVVLPVPENPLGQVT